MEGEIVYIMAGVKLLDGGLMNKSHHKPSNFNSSLLFLFLLSLTFS